VGIGTGVMMVTLPCEGVTVRDGDRGTERLSVKEELSVARDWRIDTMLFVPVVPVVVVVSPNVDGFPVAPVLSAVELESMVITLFVDVVPNRDVTSTVPNVSLVAELLPGGKSFWVDVAPLVVEAEAVIKD